jgi:hypothetical protein
LEGRTTNLPSRNASDILNETFVIYGENLWRLVQIAAVIQVPVGLLSLLVGTGRFGYASSAIAGHAGLVLVYGAVVSAVGQHYVSGNVSVRRAFASVSGRLVSLALVAIVLPLILVPAAAIVPFVDGPLVGLLGLIVLAIAVGLMVFWPMAVPCVMTQRLKAAAALRRSIRLVLGSWCRVLGIMVLVLLVAVGLGIVLSLPLALMSIPLETEPATWDGRLFQAIGGTLVTVAVLPLLAVASTLLYYDLRVRKEGYGIDALVREMALAP